MREIKINIDGKTIRLLPGWICPQNEVSTEQCLILSTEITDIEWEALEDALANYGFVGYIVHANSMIETE